MPFPRASQALSRFTVLDLTRVRAGPTCVRQLADWGANVIKIDALMEDAGGEQPGGPRSGSDFQNLHRNKRAMTLNLKDPKGLEVFRRLAEKADVVVENFRPDVKTKLGIDYESVRKINPRIVYGSISGFGQDGPYHKRPGFDQIAQGMGGLMSITGAPGAGPMRVGIPVADLTAGLFCAIGILTALLEREISGEGQWVQTSLLQAQIFMLDFQAARWLMEKDVARQAGNNHPTSIPTGVFKTSDGYINIATTGGRKWLIASFASRRRKWPIASLASARRKRRSAAAAAGKAARHSAAEAKSRFRLGLLLRHGRGHEHLVAPNHRRRPGDSRNLHLPLNILVLAPFGRELRFLRQTVRIRPSKLSPVIGLCRRGQKHQTEASNPEELL